MELLSTYFSRLEQRLPFRWQGRVLEAVGQTIESSGPLCSVGECCEILDSYGKVHQAEVIGFKGSHVLCMPLESIEGIRFGDKVSAQGVRPHLEVGEALIGRVLNASGQQIDIGLRPQVRSVVALDRNVLGPLERVTIRQPMATGIRAIDGMLTVGRGQRIGIFGGSGVGKSTLIGMMTRNSDADVIIVGLVGERGREVGEFLDNSLGPEGRKRAVVLVSTSDQSPLLRLRAALASTAVAEYFAEQGKNVLLVLDSLTRFAMAAREIGLAAGEPPTAKGYTPSVFSRMARLLERAGQFRGGSITAFYTVLMEGDDQQDPIVDAARSFLDGHIMLSRDLAAEGWYPPIQILDSVSRLMPAITSEEHKTAATLIRRMLAVYAKSEDLIRIGAYKQGADADLDRAIRTRAQVRDFLMQRSDEEVSFAGSLDALKLLATRV